MRKFTSVAELDNVVLDKWSKFDGVSDYLNDAGLAQKEALQSITWLLSFYDNLEDLNKDNSLQDLFKVENKHPEYYKTISSFIKAVEYSVEN